MVLSKAPLVSIIIVTFNSQRYIKDCLEAVFKTDYPRFEIIVVDNSSTDKTLEVVKKRFSAKGGPASGWPKTKVVESKKNLGYAGGNNLGAKKAEGEYIAILNPDTFVSKNWLKPLVKACSEEKVAACQPKIMLAQERNLINLTGKTTHFLGFDWPTDYQKKDYQMSQKEITSFSGSAFLAKKEVFKKMGGFDPAFFMYYEDGDLSWRLRLSGYKILLVPDSVVCHEYKYRPEFLKERQKFYFLERNRLQMIFKNYSAKTLILILPVALFMELGMNFYFWAHGWLFEKWRGYFWLLKNLPKIILKRKKVQRLRLVSDRELIFSFVGKAEFKEFDNIFLKYLANPVLSLYWKVVRNLI